MMKNKISLKKKVVMPRHHIIYHHRLNPRPTAIQTKQTASRVVKPKPTINFKAKRPINAKPVKPNLRTAAVKAVKSTRKSNPRRTFASDPSKINSIKDVGKNKILAILAPGPSILEVEIKKLKEIDNIDTMTINKPDTRMGDTDYWMFCDRTQYNRNIQYFNKYSRTIINSTAIKQAHRNQIKIKNLSGKGFSVDMNKGFYIGRSTTFSAMQVAIWMGYDKIFVFGCDMCRVVIEKGGKKQSLLHSYGVNPDVPEKVREKRFEKEAEFYDNAANIMGEKHRSKFYFCSKYNPWSFVQKFNKVDHREAIELIMKEAECLT